MSDKLEKLVDGVDQNKRESIKRLLTTAAFAAPVISSFAIDGRMNPANALMTNMTAS